MIVTLLLHRRVGRGRRWSSADWVPRRDGATPGFAKLECEMLVFTQVDLSLVVWVECDEVLKTAVEAR